MSDKPKSSPDIISEIPVTPEKPKPFVPPPLPPVHGEPMKPHEPVKSEPKPRDFPAHHEHHEHKHHEHHPHEHHKQEEVKPAHDKSEASPPHCETACAPFVIHAEGDLHDLLRMVREKIEEHGGTFTGNHVGGSFSGSVPMVGHFEGIYSVVALEVTITITKKPWNPMATCSRIEDKIRELYRHHVESKSVA